MSSSSSAPNNKRTLNLHPKYFYSQLRFYAYSKSKEKKIEVVKDVEAKSNDFSIAYSNEDISSDNLTSNLYSLINRDIKEEKEAHVDYGNVYVEVDVDGNVDTLPGSEIFLILGGKIIGAHSTMFPDILTTWP
ncbi:hypothetical protein L2E82_30100 [Cichorium intybus]|uniref:Uncharacterized protein n=1 Tax=Cichorium intybus TaxID=13427 RepID=A0ACB9CZD0_CICIN|nr:hypothetical protein L2E82_30100 [Cichorium intybus]